MNEKQKRFVEEYLIDLNDYAAAIRAGYSPGYNKLMQFQEVREGIDKAIAERSKRTEISQDRIIRELARIAFANPSNIVNVKESTIKENVSEDDFAAVSSISMKKIPLENGKGNYCECKVTLAGKKGALELLGKHFGMFKDYVNLNSEMGVTIINDIPRDDDDV